MKALHLPLSLLLSLLAAGQWAQAQHGAAPQALLDSAAQYNVGTPTHEQWLTLAEEHSLQLNDHAVYVAARGSKALHYFQNGQDSAAQAAIQQALGWAAVHLDSLHPSLSYAYFAGFLLANYQGAPDAAAMGERTLRTAPPQFPYETDAWNTLMLHYFRRKQLPEAEDLLDRLQQRIAQGLISPAHRVLWLRGKMLSASSNHNYEKAILYGEQCVYANDSFNFYPPIALAPICIEIGRPLAKLKRFTQGLYWMEKGLAYADLAPNDPVLGGYYINIANLLNEAQRHREALDYYQKALELYLQHETRYRNRLDVLYQNIGRSFRNIGAYDEAIAATQNALRYRSSIASRLLQTSLAGKSPQGLTVAQGLDSLQRIIAELHNPSLSTDPYSPKGNPPRYADTPSPYWLALALSQKASFLVQEATAAQDTSLLALAVHTLDLSDHYHEAVLYAMQGYDRSQLAYAEWVHFNWLIRVMAHTHWQELAPSTTQQALALHAIDQAHDWAIQQRRSETPTAIRIAQLKRNQYELSRAIALWTSNDADSLAQLRKALQAQYLELEQLQAMQQQPRAVSSQSVAKLQATLAPSDQMILYTQLIEKVHITVISRDSITFVTVPLPQHKTASILPDVYAIHALLDAPLLHQRAYRERFVEHAHQLYQYLVQPIKGLLRPESHLIIVPDAEYLNLPFELLLASNAEAPWSELDFWVRHHPISYHYSAQRWQNAAQQQPIASESFLGIAPSFDECAPLPDVYAAAEHTGTNLRSAAAGRLNPLPLAQREVRSIDETLGNQGTLLLGTSATRTAMTQALSAAPYRHIHIATHGLLHWEQPELSALACAADITRSAADYLLFMDEVAALDIKADLVVLGSCESGLGQYFAGAAPFTMSLSFVEAGAHNVIHTTRKLNDEYGYELFTRFYNLLVQHPKRGYAKALQQAKCEMLRDPVMANPRYWSPVLLIGR